MRVYERPINKTELRSNIERNRKARRVVAGFMRIKAILPYYGAKRKRASQIIEVFGKHRVYWEPFCGSMAVLMLKKPCEMETVSLQSFCPKKKNPRKQQVEVLLVNNMEEGLFRNPTQASRGL